MQQFKIKETLSFLIAICLLCFFITHSFYYFHLLSLNTVFGYQMISLWIYAITDVLIAFFIVLFIALILYKIITFIHNIFRIINRYTFYLFYCLSYKEKRHISHYKKDYVFYFIFLTYY